MKKLIGLLIIVALVFSLAGCKAGESTKNKAEASANAKPTNVTDLSDANWQVADFNFTDENGKPFGLSDLKGKVWLADFIFTSCETVCPPMTANMSKLQEKLKAANANVQIVSFSVDPTRDTPDKLKAFGEKFDADFSNWHFLTGYDFSTIKDLSEKSFKSAVAEPAKGSDQFTHGTSFYLIDQNGHIDKLYHGYSDVPFNQVVKDVISLNKDKKQATDDMSDMAMATMSPLKVDIMTKADSFKPGQEGTLKVKVTKEDKPVSDAEEMLFEIWKKGDKASSKKYKGKNDGNGIYTLHYTFKEKGTYEVTAHVTVRGSHTMPTKDFIVGN